MKAKHNSGERNGMNVLTEGQVRELRLLRPHNSERRRYPKDHPLSLFSLAQRFGIKPSQISKICLGTAWAHVPRF